MKLVFNAVSGTFDLVGELSSVIINTPITGFLSGAGVLSATDSILEAINKLDGNIVSIYDNPSFTGVVGMSAGGSFNFDSGDVTITHSTNALAFAGATAGYSFDSSIRSIFATVANTANATLATVTQGLTKPGNLVTSAYVADGYTAGLIWSSTDDNPAVPKAGIFSRTSGDGSYIFFGTSASYVTGITTSISIGPNGSFVCGTLAATYGDFSGRVHLTGDNGFVSASGDAYVYHASAGGLVLYGSGSVDDITIAGATGANIIGVASGTTTTRFYGAVNIGGTFTRRTQSGVLPVFQVEGTDFDSSSMSLFANNTASATTCPALFLTRSRGSAVGSNTVVQSGDRLGLILFEGTDGSISQPGAIIQCYVDGTPGAGDMPGRLEFLTTPDGSSTPTLRLTISNAGISTFTGTVVTPASTTSGASLNIPHGTAPTSPVDGDMWSTTTTLNFRLNGVTKTVTLV